MVNKQHFAGSRPTQYVFASLTQDGLNAADVPAVVATDLATPAHGVASIALLYGYDPVDANWDAVGLEGADVRNMRTAIFAGAAGPAAVAAATATLDPTAATFLKGMVGIYGMGAANLERLLSQANNADNVAAVAAGALATIDYGYLWDAAGANWDRALGIAGAAVVDGPLADNAAFTFNTSHVFPSGFVADEVAPTSVGENAIGAARMTLTRVLNTVATDPTTITQRQNVVAPAATLNEATAQMATGLAVLYGFNPASGAGSAIARLTTVQGPVADVAGGGTLGVGLMATFDDVAAGATTENNVGLLRMTATRILNAVASDPTTPTQRQRVTAANAALSETATQYANTLASLFGLDTGAGAGSQVIPIRAFPSGADGVSNTQNALAVAGAGYHFNNSTWDRARNNHELAALASAARVATTQSGTLVSYDTRGMAILLDVTAVGAPAGQINSIEVQALITASWQTIYQFPAINLAAAGQRFFLIYPGAASAGSWSQAPMQGTIPRQFRIQCTHNDANSITYAVTCSMLV